MLILPDGRSDCLIRGRLHADGSVDALVPVLTGPGTIPMRVTRSPGEVWVGARLRPEAAYRMWGGALAFAKNRTVRGGPHVQALLPGLDSLRTRYESMAALQQALLQALHRTVDRARTIDDAAPELVQVLHALHVRRGDVRVHELAAVVGWSDRHLARRFGAAVGLSPKRYADLMRLHAALRALLVQGQDASTVAYNAGYADQSHFVRAVHRYTGMSPSRLPADLSLPALPFASR